MRKKLSLTSKIFIAMGVGLAVGVLVRSLPAGTVKDTIIIGGVFKVLGQGFISAIKMLVVPLVFASITCGVASLSNIKSLGRIGVRTLIFYISTTAIAISISIGLAYLINPGVGLDMSSLVSEQPTIAQSSSFADVLIDMIPTNPIKAMAEGNMLQVISFSIIFGVTISILGEKVKLVKTFMENLNEIFLKMVNLVMYFAPFGVFGLIATTFATTGVEAFASLLKYMAVVLLGLLIHASVVYTGILKIFTNLSIMPFVKKFPKVGAITFSTASSNASVPASMEILEELGVGKTTRSFTIPMGATINMDGTAIMQGVAALFIAQIYGIDLSINQMITIILTATLASIGTAGVPGVGMIMLSMVLTSVNLPLEGIGLIMGVERIIDMFRTTVNVMGDNICTLIIANSENDFDKDMFYGEKEEQLA